MAEKISGIYKIVFKNKEKEIIYVGQSNNMLDRFKQHKRKLKDNEHHSVYMQNVYNKYGINYFSFVVLEECQESELNEREIYWIKHYNSKDKGFNSTYGGEGTTGFKHKDGYSEQMRQLMLQTGQNRKKVSQYSLDGEHIKNWDSMKDACEYYNIDSSSMSKCVRGKNISLSGYIWRFSEDSFNKYRTKAKINTSINKYLIDGTFVKKYNSIRIAEKEESISRGKIKNSCEGKNQVADGFVWRYEGDGFDKYKIKNTRDSSIVQLSTNLKLIKIWKNSKELIQNNYEIDKIRRCCRGEESTHNKYLWIYFEDYTYKTPLFYEIINKRKKEKFIQVDMIDPITMKIVKTYESLKEASKESGFSAGSISGACESKKEYKIGGYFWRKTKNRVEEKHFIENRKIGTEVFQIDPNTKEVIKKFNMIADASEYFGKDRKSSDISNAIRNHKLCFGYYWEKSI